MTPAQQFNETQRERWNGEDGEFWVRQQDRLDRTLAPVTGPLLAFAAPRSGSIVLDVGCGCGATTIELARAVGPSGRVIGLDIVNPVDYVDAALGKVRNFSSELHDLMEPALSKQLPLVTFPVAGSKLPPKI